MGHEALTLVTYVRPSEVCFSWSPNQWPTFFDRQKPRANGAFVLSTAAQFFALSLGRFHYWRLVVSFNLSPICKSCGVDCSIDILLGLPRNVNESVSELPVVD